VYLRPTLATPTDASDSSCWPSPTVSEQWREQWRTPDAPNAGGVRTHTTSRQDGHQTTIAEQAEHWATPTTRDYRSGLGEQQRAGTPALNETRWPTPNVPNGGRSTSGSPEVHHHQSLEATAGQWPTPNTRDSSSAARHTTTTGIMHPGTTLTDAVRGDLWPTPTAEPYGSSQNGINGIGGEAERPSANTPSLARLSRSFLRGLARDSSGAPSLLTDQSWPLPFPEEVSACASPATPWAASPAKPQLNPVFVEWLMGWPLGWTGSAPVGMEWYRWRQRMRSALSRLVWLARLTSDTASGTTRSPNSTPATGHYAPSRSR
jgi:hypothetical protein